MRLEAPHRPNAEHHHVALAERHVYDRRLARHLFSMEHATGYEERVDVAIHAKNRASRHRGGRTSATAASAETAAPNIEEWRSLLVVDREVVLIVAVHDRARLVSDLRA